MPANTIALNRAIRSLKKQLTGNGAQTTSKRRRRRRGRTARPPTNASLDEQLHAAVLTLRHSTVAKRPHKADTNRPGTRKMKSEDISHELTVLEKLQQR